MLTTYRLDSDKTVILGTEQSTGITEILFPDVNYAANVHSMTITKKFDGQSKYRWEVMSVTHPSALETVIDLKPRIPSQPEVFLAQTHKRKRSVISALRKGTLVEVDYGFIPSVKKSCGTTRSNKRYPDLKQSGEMHKRRLAIVIKATGNRVQVVPISSKVPPINDRTCFELDFESVEKLVNYNDRDKNSYAICGMIETVSLTRILPPLARPIKAKGRQEPQRSEGYPHRLTPVDLNALDDALSVTMGMSDYRKLKRDYPALYSENESNKDEIEKLQQELDIATVALKAEQQKTQQYKALWNYSETQYMQFNPGVSEGDARAAIQAELVEWMALEDT